jgi:exodeoxyribonuclease VII large subunit
VVQRVSGAERHVIRGIADAPPGAQLRIRVADGAVAAVALGTETLVRKGDTAKPSHTAPSGEATELGAGAEKTVTGEGVDL